MARLALLPLVSAIFLLCWWAWQGLQDDLGLERERVTRFERLAASHVFNGVGMELFRLHFHFAVAIGHAAPLKGEDWAAALRVMTDGYLANARYPELLQDVLMAQRDGPGWRWTRLTNGRWVPVPAPAWFKPGDLEFAEPLDPSVDLERPVMEFPLPDSGAVTRTLVLRYRVETVVQTIVPALVKTAFLQPAGRLAYATSVARVVPGAVPDPQVDLVTPLVPTTRFSEWSRSDIDEALNAPELSDQAASALDLDVPPHPNPAAQRWVLQVTVLPAGLRAYTSQLEAQNLAWAVSLFVFITGGSAAFFFAVSRLLRASERERAFSTLISHELKTPLAAALSLSENLAGGYVKDPEKVQTYGSRLVEQMGRLSTMVESILSLSRLRLTGEVSAAEGFDLAAVAVEAASEAGVPEPLPGPGPWVARGNRSAIRSALDNLVANALHYGWKDGEPRVVEVGLRRTRGWIGVSVTDHGYPVGRSERKAWFKPYYRGAEAHRRQLPGSGVGLTLVKVTMSLLGGRVQVQPVAGGGLTFILWLRKGVVS